MGEARNNKHVFEKIIAAFVIAMMFFSREIKVASEFAKNTTSENIVVLATILILLWVIIQLLEFRVIIKFHAKKEL